MIKLCLIDDDPRLTNLIKKQLESSNELQWIKTSESGLRYVRSLEHQPLDQIPDCILMDISMDEPDEGIQATSILHLKFPQIKVIMFTMSDDDDHIFEAFKSGAVGYLLKNEKAPFILKAVIEVVNGYALLSPGIALKTILFMAGSQKSEPQANASKLTERELEILTLIAKGITYNQIADNLSISNQTVKKHVSNIFHKLQVNNKVEAINKSRTFL
jgi:DNA-binding NarL/FixJ family response regulator